MLNLKDMIGTIVFSSNGNYIVGASERQNTEFRQKCQATRAMFDTDLLQERLQNRDSVEIKGITHTVLTCENYNDIRKVTEMPKSIFGESYGYQMQKDIAGCMKQYYAGELSDEDVKGFFQDCCSAMRVRHSQMRHTTGVNVEDNTQIVSQVYEIFAKENQRAARNANYEEGLKINSQYGANSRQDCCYYNADYYYQCEDTRDLLRGIVADMAKEWELPPIDTDEIEKNSKFTLDGGFDFNSGWNFTYRNQVSRSSMEDETMVPPKGFKFFYKEGGGESGAGKGIDNGIVQFWVGENSRKVEVPFYISRDGSLKGQIFNLSDLAGLSGRDTGNYREYNEFSRNFSVFTGWYAYKSGIRDRFGNYVPGCK